MFFVVCFDISIYSLGVNSECFDTTFIVVICFVLTSVPSCTTLVLTVSALTPPCVFVVVVVFVVVFVLF